MELEIQRSRDRASTQSAGEEAAAQSKTSRALQRGPRPGRPGHAGEAGTQGPGESSLKDAGHEPSQDKAAPSLLQEENSLHRTGSDTNLGVRARTSEPDLSPASPRIS